MRRLVVLAGMLVPSHLIAQALPTQAARTAPTYQQGQSAQFWVDTSGHAHFKCDSGCVPYSGDTLGYLAHVLDSLMLRAAYKHVGTVAVDTAKGCLTTANGCDIHVYADTLGHIRDSVNVSANVKDSINLRAQKAGNEAYVKCDSGCAASTASTADTIYTFKGCTIAGTCVIYVKVDSVPVTSAGRLDSISRINHVTDSLTAGYLHLGRIAADSLIGGTLVQKATPAYAGTGYQPIWADTSGRQVFRLDSASHCVAAANGCDVHVIIDTAEASRVGYPPGDSLQRADSMINLDTDYVRAADTCVTSFGAKSAADSASFPAVSGKYIYLTGIALAICDTAAVTGTTYLTITTSNLRSLQFEAGNAGAVGTCTSIPTSQVSTGFPLRSTASNTLTQIKIPAAGTGAYGYISMCGYYHALRRWGPTWRVTPPSPRDVPHVDGSAEVALLEPLGRRDAA